MTNDNAESRLPTWPETVCQTKKAEVWQKLIDECNEWSETNAMMLNASKTEVMNVSLRKTLCMTGAHMLHPTHQVDQMTEAKLLGVTINNHLTFHVHRDNIIRTANPKCHGLLLMKWAGVNTDSLITLYQSQVRPSLTYSAAARYPYTTTAQREQLEKTQKLALRIIFHSTDHYDDRLALAGLRSLCRELNNLICSRYAENIYQLNNHLLHDRIPKHPEGQHFYRRTSTTDI